MSITDTDTGKITQMEKNLLNPGSFGTGPADTDLILALDRSASMKGVPFEKLKISAKNLINIMYSKNHPARSDQVGDKDRIGIVSFSNIATKDQILTQSVEHLKTAIDKLETSAGSNHYDGFMKACELFDPLSEAKKVLVMFTDGFASAGSDPLILAAALKNSGIFIYVIGLEGARGTIAEVITDWASYPPWAYTDLTDDLEQIDTLFEKIAIS